MEEMPATTLSCFRRFRGSVVCDIDNTSLQLRRALAGSMRDWLKWLMQCCGAHMSGVKHVGGWDFLIEERGPHQYDIVRNLLYELYHSGLSSVNHVYHYASMNRIDADYHPCIYFISRYIELNRSIRSNVSHIISSSFKAIRDWRLHSIAVMHSRVLLSRYRKSMMWIC